MRKVLFILGQLSDEDVDWLANAGRRQQLVQGDVLITEGKPVEALYFILDGTLEVNAKGVGRLATLSCGEIVGEMSMIDQRPPSASVGALTASVVLAVPRAALEKKVAQDVVFAAHFYKAVATFLSDRLRSTVKRMGYGEEVSLDEDVEIDGELDFSVLDNLHLAGARFDRILKKFMG